jgi:hypothetical protein
MDMHPRPSEARLIGKNHGISDDLYGEEVDFALDTVSDSRRSAFGPIDDALREFSEVVGEVVQEYIGEIPSTEIIVVLETAKACVISQAIKEWRGEG